jgi:hypothetical protein
MTLSTRDTRRRLEQARAASAIDCRSSSSYPSSSWSSSLIAVIAPAATAAAVAIAVAIAVAAATTIAATTAVVDCYVFVTPLLDFDGNGHRRRHP